MQKTANSVITISCNSVSCFWHFCLYVTALAKRQIGNLGDERDYDIQQRSLNVWLKGCCQVYYIYTKQQIFNTFSFFSSSFSFSFSLSSLFSEGNTTITSLRAICLASEISRLCSSMMVASSGISCNDKQEEEQKSKV